MKPTRISIIFCFFTCSTFFAGSNENKIPENVSLLIKPRLVASLQIGASLQSATKVPIKNYVVALRILAGGSLSNTISNVLSANLSAGVDINLYLIKFLILETSFFYLPNNNGEKILNSPITNESFTATVSEKSSDFISIAKGQLAFDTGRWLRWIPRVGIGYGAYTQSISTDGFPAPLQSNVSTSLTIAGLYGYLGTEVMLANGYSFNADYTFGLTTTDSSDGRMASNRLRTALSYRITPSFHIGAEYCMRAFRAETSNDSVEQVRYLGFVQIKL